MIKNLFRLLRFFRNPVEYAIKLGVKVGDNNKISTYDFGSDPFLITIGNNCHITKKVKFITHDGGVWVFRKEIPDFDVFGAIKIEDNVYIGNGSIIMPGVTIGSNVVVGANSLVSKSVPSNTVVAGIPAKIVCTLEEYKLKMEPKNFKTKGLKGEERKRQILNLIATNGIEKPYLVKYDK